MNLKLPRELIERVLHAAIAIQQIAAPTFAEGRRAEYVRDQFAAAGLKAVEVDAAGNVYARRPAAHRSGLAPRPPVVVSAHTDTVFPAGTDLTLRRDNNPARLIGPGIGDNALGVASLLGLAWALDALGCETPGDVWLVANTCEEGLGDLCGMRALVDRFGPEASAYLVVEGMALGHIYYRGVGVRRFRISARARDGGGHSWLHFGRPSAIHALVRLGARLADLSMPASPKTTFNIGVISGGTSVNTIAAEASLQLDLRSEDPAALAALVERVEALCRADSTAGVELRAEIIGDRPAGGIARDHPLVRLAADVLTACGVQRENVTLETGSTDANVPLSLGLPSVCVGITRGGNAHRPDEYIETEPVETGLKQLTALVLGIYSS